MTAAEIPSAAKTLLKQLEGWSLYTHAATGQFEYGGLSEDTDGAGKRHRVSTLEDVDSYRIQGKHVDGRAFEAIWVHRHGDLTPAGGRKWKLDMAWRGKRRDEFAPKQVTATELKAYVAWPQALDLKEAA